MKRKVNVRFGWRVLTTLLAFALVLTTALGTVSTVFAEEAPTPEFTAPVMRAEMSDDGTVFFTPEIPDTDGITALGIEPQALTPLPTPTNIRFDGADVLVDKAPPAGAAADWSCDYNVRVIDPRGDVVADSHWVGISADFTPSFTVYDCLIETGNYRFEVAAIPLDPDEATYTKSAYVSMDYYFTNPSVALNLPTALRWTLENGKLGVSFTIPDAQDIKVGYQIVFLNAEGASSGIGFPEGTKSLMTYWPAGSSSGLKGEYFGGTWSGPHYNTNETISTPVPSEYNFTAGKQYYFQVWALSGDPSRAHSTVSAVSPPLDLDMLNAAVGDVLSDVSSKVARGEITVAEALETVKKIDQNMLSLAMQTDAGILAQIAGLEGQYKTEKGISVTTAVSPEVQAKLAGDVNVVGAGLNSAGGGVTLTFENKKKDVEIDSEYWNYVQLNIGLSGVTNAGSLDVPIPITMPAPSNLDPHRLTIMHYTSSGYYDIVPFTINGNGTISFTVTHLSEFVFAEESAATGTEIHRLYNPSLPANISHHYSGDLNEIRVLTTEDVWIDEGVKFIAATTGTPVYRLYNPNDGRHLITKDENEKNTLSTPEWGWNFEGISFYEPADTTGKTPIYRLYLPGFMEHLWTADDNEVRVLSTEHGWNDEGVKFYAEG